MKTQEAIINARIGAKLRELRRFRKWTQEQLGEAMGVTYQQVQKYETGANRIPLAKLIIGCREMNISMTNFYE